MKEERIIYPEGDRTLAPDASTRWAAFIESVKMPSGGIATKTQG